MESIHSTYFVIIILSKVVDGRFVIFMIDSIYIGEKFTLFTRE